MGFSREMTTMDGVVGTEAEKILPNRLGGGTFLVRHDDIAPRAVPWYSGTSQSTGQPGASVGKRVKMSVMPTRISGVYRSDKRRPAYVVSSGASPAAPVHVDCIALWQK
jgi:hypothetical protein